MDIRKKMIKGAGWLFLEKGAQQISSFVVFAVIARMIGPEEYGLVALCTIVLALTNNITLGLVDSIISMKIRDDERLSSLFWFVLGIGAILSLFALFIAEPFAIFFEQQKLSSLMRAFAVIPFLYALAAVPTALITATMDFRVFTLRTLVASLIGGGAGVYFAFHGWGAFALAVQQIVAQCITVLILFASSSWRPHLIFKLSTLKKMLHLGMGQTGSLFLSFIEQQMPRLILGVFIGPVAVGYYAFVRRILGVLQDGIIQPVLNVVYPAISEIIDNQEEKEIIVRQTIFVLGAIIFPIVTGIIITAPLFIPLLFGDKWIETYTLVQIYAPALFFVSFNLLMRNILRSHKLIFVYLRIQTVVTILATIGAFCIVSHGTSAVLIIMVIASCLSAISSLYLVWKRVHLPIWHDLLSLSSSLVSSLMMGGVVLWVMQSFSENSSNTAALCLSIAIGAISYVALLALIEFRLMLDVFSRIAKTISRKKPVN